MKKRIFLLIVVSLAALGWEKPAKAQDVAVKTNLLYDVLLNANVGAEVGLAPRWSFDLSGNLNAWPVNDRKWKHWLLQPELRYWFCDRFAGHFVGAHLLGGQYNWGNLKNNISFLGSDFSPLTDRRFQGWYAGAGVAYGYAFVLDRHWNLELEIGAGYIYTRSDVYQCQTCGLKIEEGRPHHYVGPTKAAVNLVYIF